MSPFLSDATEIVKLVVPSGIVIGAVKYIMNGWRASLQRIESKQDTHGEMLGDLSERTVRIETKLEACPGPANCPPQRRRRSA